MCLNDFDYRLTLSCAQVDDKLYIYLEYVSGGSIHKLLQEYGQFGEPIIRSYTRQILAGLAYLHSKSTVHRCLSRSGFDDSHSQLILFQNE
jgi:serine/threonine protein kinase